MANKDIDYVGTPEARRHARLMEAKLLTKGPKVYEWLQKSKALRDLGLKGKARKRATQHPRVSFFASSCKEAGVKGSLGCP